MSVGITHCAQQSRNRLSTFTRPCNQGHAKSELVLQHYDMITRTDHCLWELLISSWGTTIKKSTFYIHSPM